MHDDRINAIDEYYDSGARSLSSCSTHAEASVSTFIATDIVVLCGGDWYISLDWSIIYDADLF